MTCEDWQELILDQESLDDLERQELRQHFSKCAGCRAWAEALAETDARLTEALSSEVDPSELGARVLRAVDRERRQSWQSQSPQSWMSAAPELLDSLGWGAVGALAVAGFMFWTHWASFDNHLVWLGAAAVLGSVAWAGSALSREKSEAGPIL